MNVYAKLLGALVFASVAVVICKAEWTAEKPSSGRVETQNTQTCDATTYGNGSAVCTKTTQDQCHCVDCPAGASPKNYVCDCKENSSGSVWTETFNGSCITYTYTLYPPCPHSPCPGSVIRVYTCSFPSSPSSASDQTGPDCTH